MVTSITSSMDRSLRNIWVIVEDRGAWMLQSVGFKESEERAQSKDDTLSATVSLFPAGDSQSLLGVEMGKATSNVSRKTKRRQKL